ncbi:hypothetical protein V4R08_15385 [Nitrobacter sp. NHB1]|uniref:hypothetical protein n=1 Tax=Nitrobacter sp. NHB1 TaxID=3119830 RepID=UPI003000A5AD
MHNDKTITRSNLMWVGFALSVMAFLLVAYSQFGNIPPARAATSSASPAAALAFSASKIATPASEREATRQDACGEQTWPYFSKGCLRGVGRELQPREIAITREAATASVVMNDQTIQTAAVTPSRHKASRIKHHKRVRRNLVAARSIQAREAFAEASPDQLRNGWPATW